MMDYTADAEALFRDFALRHSFAIEKVDHPEVELLMRVPEQTGLSFELTLGLQNGDELNIGFEEFWSYFFPFEEKTITYPRTTSSDTWPRGANPPRPTVNLHRQAGLNRRHRASQKRVLG